MATNETSKYKLSITEGTELQLSLNGPTGAVGPANVLAIGNVATAESGINASATITGTSPSQTLNLTLPKGDTGTAATVEVSNTITTFPGTQASVVNLGDSSAAVFQFRIPRGDKGETGLTGPANTLSVSSTSTGVAGSSANVTISGTSPSQSLAFVIPRGDKGDTGDIGPIGPTGQSSSYYPYLAKTTVNSGDPDSTFLLWNNATQRNSTQINVSHITFDSSDIDVFLALLKVNDFIIIQSKTNSDNFQKWQISSTTTIVPNDYIQIPVTYVDSGGTGYTNFSSNEQIIFVFVATGATGPTGPSNTLSIGNVTEGGIGNAGASITGTAPNQTLNLVLPTGATGATGATGNAATVSAGLTLTGAPGSSASVTNSGDTSAAVFDFTIPRGDVGETGPTGPIGPQPSLTVADNANTAITLADSDNNAVIRCTSSAAVTITVPSTLAAGFSCMVIQAGTGQITIEAGAGTTLNSFGNLLKTAGRHAPASIIRVGAGVFNLSGNLI